MNQGRISGAAAAALPPSASLEELNSMTAQFGQLEMTEGQRNAAAAAAAAVAPGSSPSDAILRVQSGQGGHVSFSGDTAVQGTPGWPLNGPNHAGGVARSYSPPVAGNPMGAARPDVVFSEEDDRPQPQFAGSIPGRPFSAYPEYDSQYAAETPLANYHMGGPGPPQGMLGSMQDLSANLSSHSMALPGGGLAPMPSGLFKPSDDHLPEKVLEISPNGRYAKLQCLLGKGAYKVVYKAIDREEGFEVAWNSCQTSKAEFQELTDEIDILKRVRHPNIIQFHDCWWNANEFVFITELMTSGTLREYIPKLGRPNLKIVKRWSRQILKGLSYLHAHNPPIIHRDIKCDNIFINGAHGEVKIGDMGTAKMRQGKKYTVIGTPEFMAPEMYEERGYSEKVDIYAFGMALLEMVTGEYPYSECKNAAQIYKKVSQGIKPQCLTRVSDAEVLDLINQCIDDEASRPSAQEISEHPFFAVEPEVILLNASDTKKFLEMQVVFKGMEKLSVKFEFNVDSDTAEDVVHEMIQEQVLPNRYQQLITSEINRILREMNKYTPETDRNREENRTVWTRHEVSGAGVVGRYGTGAPVSADDDTSQTGAVQQQLSPPQQLAQVPVPQPAADSPPAELADADPRSRDVNAFVSPLAGPPQAQPQQPLAKDEEQPVVYFGKEYDDEAVIEDLVRDVAVANNRGVQKADEWVARLKEQDIMTIGDLRELHNQDWASLGLTVFASRALKNALHGKQLRNFSPRVLSRSGSLYAVTSPNQSTVQSAAGVPPGVPTGMPQLPPRVPEQPMGVRADAGEAAPAVQSFPALGRGAVMSGGSAEESGPGERTGG